MTAEKRPRSKEPATPAMMTTQEVGALIEALRSEFKLVLDGQADLRERLDGVKEMVAHNAEETTLLKLEVIALKHEVAELKQRVTALEREMIVVKQELAELKHRVTALEQEMSAVKGEQGRTTNRLDRIEEKLDRELAGISTRLSWLESRATPN